MSFVPRFIRSVSRPLHIGVAGMAKKNAQKFYAVAVGKKPGIYTTWAECSFQVRGHPNAKFKSFATRDEADGFIRRFVEATGDDHAHAAGVKRPHDNQSGASTSSPTAASSSTTADRREGPLQKKPRPDCEVVAPNDDNNDDNAIVDIFTDGACTNQGTPRAVGGVGASFPPELSHLDVSEPLASDRPTNNQAELTAVLRALEQAIVADIKRVRINTDSVYVFNGFTTQWVGIHERPPKGMPNEDIICRIARLVGRFEVGQVRIEPLNFAPV